jgi:hypothetical protein
LISIVVDEAHVLDKHIANSPLAVNVMQPVIDGNSTPFSSTTLVLTSA